MEKTLTIFDGGLSAEAKNLKRQKYMKTYFKISFLESKSKNVPNFSQLKK